MMIATWERQLAAGAGEGNRTLIFSLGIRKHHFTVGIQRMLQ